VGTPDDFADYVELSAGGTIASLQYVIIYATTAIIGNRSLVSVFSADPGPGAGLSKKYATKERKRKKKKKNHNIQKREITSYIYLFYLFLI
jgi:hypothetical protein